MDKISHFLLSKSVEDLILRSHLGLRSSSGSSGLSLTSGPICVRRSQSFPSVMTLPFVDWTLVRVHPALS